MGYDSIGKEILARVRQHVAVGRAHSETDAAVRRRELDGGAACLGNVDEHGFGLRRSGGRHLADRADVRSETGLGTVDARGRMRHRGGAIRPGILRASEDARAQRDKRREDDASALKRIALLIARLAYDEPHVKHPQNKRASPHDPL